VSTAWSAIPACARTSAYARTNRIRHPRAVYLREAEIVPDLDTWLTRALDPAHLPGTPDVLAAAQLAEPSPEAAALSEEIAQYDRQLVQYRAALESGGDPAVIGAWISET